MSRIQFAVIATAALALQSNAMASPSTVGSNTASKADGPTTRAIARCDATAGCDLSLLVATPLLGGDYTPVQVGDGMPGNLVYILAGDRGWSTAGFTQQVTAIPGCPDLESDVADARVLGAGFIGRDGTLSFEIELPKNASGTMGHFQAVDVGDCLKSNVFVAPVQ